MSEERVAIFIDGSNLYHCLKTQFGNPKIDMGKFVQKLCAGRKLMRTYYYNAAVRQQDDPERYRSQQQFFDALRKIPYFQVKLGRLEPRGNTYVEKGVDLAMAVDILLMAFTNVYDTAILVTGDGDFADLVEEVKERGKHVENAFVTSGRSRALADASDKFIEIDRVFWQDVVLPSL